ncbi:MAG: hypothetical protein E5V58_02015 [Mesorhizobium sp.]|nr:MAG: hypothetical protein E5V58_02015 [Mesorhizobium sp.]
MTTEAENGVHIGTPGGMLTGQAIRERGIIERASDSCYRYASYDLRIGELIQPDGNVVLDYVLPPRGIVEVISRERVAVPDDLVGTAMVKTSLCNDGILALGIGVIDPGWDGQISSYLINFGKNPRHLGAGDVFLRATFQRLDGPLPIVQRVSKTDVEIRDLRRKATVGGIGTSFLNLAEELDKLSREHENKRWLTALTYVSIMALILTILAFFMTWFSSGLAGKPQNRSVEQSQPVTTEIDLMRAENAELRSRLAEIEDRLRSIDSAQGQVRNAPKQPGVSSSRPGEGNK